MSVERGMERRWLLWEAFLGGDLRRERGLKLHGEAGGKAIIWGGLESGRVHDYGEADADLGTEAAEGGDGGGAEIEGGQAGIGGGLAEESIGAFGFA